MQAVITNPITNIPKLEKSHVKGWSLVWADQLKAKIDHACSSNILNASIVYIEHGVNFGGTLNLFGGATQEIFDKLDRIQACKNVVSLDIDMVDWGDQLKKRIGAPTTCASITESWCDALSIWCKSVKSLKQQDLTHLSGISVGDSHTPAYSRINDIVLRENGKTLFGMLKRGLESEFRGMVIPKQPITCSYGSIDIRHHILRHADFNLTDMLKEYVKQGRALEDKYGCDVFYAAPVPVEFEDRRLPKTGYFKGTPFFGSRKDRLDLTLRFIEELKKVSGDKVVSPPDFWYEMDGKKYAEMYMENGSSVHIAPPYYRRNGWGPACLV
jgi:hypothetical protein